MWEGIERGRSVEQLTAEFGDSELAAELITRSRRRLRLNDDSLAREARLRDESGWVRLLLGWRFDVAYAVRSLRQNPGFVLTAIVMLALGTGVNTAIFSVTRATLLSSLLLPESERIVRPFFSHPGKGIARTNVPYVDLMEWRQEAELFDAVAHYSGVGMDLQEDPPQRIFGLQVSPDFFLVFQATPGLGRLFDQDDYRETEAQVIILSQSFWESRLAASPEVLGSVLRLNGRPLTVIGVIDSSATWPSSPNFWIPQIFPASAAIDLARRDNFNQSVIARLAPGVSLEQARSRLSSMSSRVALQDPAMREGWQSGAVELREWIVGTRLPSILLVLLAAATLVFLIACTNVPGLLATRASAGRRQLALRVALGARPSDLVRHLLTESLLLFLLGAVVGLILALVAVDAVLALAPTTIPRLSMASIDLTEFLFAFGFAACAGLIFGLYPAWQAGRQDPTRGLKEGMGASSSTRSSRFRKGLVIAEMSLSVVLLIGAGLMIRSLNAMNRGDPGFRLDHLLIFGIYPRPEHYPDLGSVERIYDQLTQHLESVPGVSGAATTTWMPIGGGGIGLGRAHLAEGMPESPSGPEYSARWVVVGPDLLETLGWILTTLEVWSRLWISFKVGRRNFRNIKAVMLDTIQRGRFERRFLFTTDGFEMYE